MTDKEKKLKLLEWSLRSQIIDIERSHIPYGKTLDCPPKKDQVLHFGHDRYDVVELTMEDQPKPEDFIYTNQDVYIRFNGRRFVTTLLEGLPDDSRFAYKLEKLKL